MLKIVRHEYRISFADRAPALIHLERGVDRLLDPGVRVRAVDHRKCHRQALFARLAPSWMTRLHEKCLYRVVVFPPLVPLTTVVSSILMQAFLPLQLFALLTVFVRLPIGAVLLGAGIGMMASGRRALTRNGTHVQTSLPTLVLVESGIYRWTRNPLYVGGCLVMFGVAFLCALDWLPLIFPLSLMVMHFGIVKREELYLERKFGDEYLSYASRVPRYFRLLAVTFRR